MVAKASCLASMLPLCAGPVWLVATGVQCSEAVCARDVFRDVFFGVSLLLCPLQCRLRCLFVSAPLPGPLLMNKLGELQDVCWHSFLIVNLPRHVPSQFDGCRSVFCTAAAPRHLTKVSSVRLHALMGHFDVTACRSCVSEWRCLTFTLCVHFPRGLAAPCVASVSSTTLQDLCRWMLMLL